MWMFFATASLRALAAVRATGQAVALPDRQPGGVSSLRTAGPSGLEANANEENNCLVRRGEVYFAFAKSSKLLEGEADAPHHNDVDPLEGWRVMTMSARAWRSP